ncbi:PEP-CTERM sorting domain-containing protein [Nostoc parmelioides]|uniref:PEP-CTERM sorting domain-containing protein n=1 Tax=Nostoc parmelioides FACHB-3921 TaxID=2692909 RepID=A0ABR8BAU4_9NOSO|nr:PEP-CTERM sorting domain-containing protein [Nostoc parmelioides]MBD2250839.1 PEP-CTERM sorting domain-containing protein [Nostoc parmelioides FACHB-3921]
MFTYKSISLGLLLTLLGSITLPTKALGQFSYDANETVIVETDFDSTDGWSLRGTSIDAGKIFGSSAWGTASYSLKNPVNLDLGPVSLYWSGIFPRNARTEPEKYYVGLQYADNSPVCYNSSINRIVGTPPCPSGSSIVDENAELRAEIRPYDAGNSGNRYHRLYIDPDFDPVNNESPASTLLDNKDRTNSVTDFRLRVSKVSSTSYEASLAYWDLASAAWKIFDPKSTSNSSPLEILASKWINADKSAPAESPVTFEAINLQFRKASTRNSEITALALTQIVLPLQQPSITVPEGYSIIGLPLVMGFGILLKRQKQK